MVLAVDSNYDLCFSNSKQNIANYEFAVKYYLDITKEEKKQITSLVVDSFKNILHYKLHAQNFEDSLFGTLSIILYFKTKIVGYCSLCPYLTKDFTDIMGQKFNTYGIHWLCIHKHFRGNYLGTELLAKSYNIIDKIASKRPNPVILFGEFTKHSYYLSQKLFQTDPQLIIGYGMTSQVGQLISSSFANFLTEYNQVEITSDMNGKLSNGNTIVALQFN